MELRPYQQEAKDAIFEQWDSGVLSIFYSSICTDQLSSGSTCSAGSSDGSM